MGLYADRTKNEKKRNSGDFHDGHRVVKDYSAIGMIEITSKVGVFTLRAS